MSGEAGRALIDLLWLVPALPLLGFVLNGALALSRSSAKRAVSIIGVGVLVAAFALAAAISVQFARLHSDGPIVLDYWDWFVSGKLRVGFALQLDQLSVVMLLVVTGVSALIHVYSVGYMQDDPGYRRYFAYLNLFVFFMLVLVLGANFPVTFVGWEGVGLCSYLLIGFWFDDKAKADAGLKAFIVNRIGDVGFLVAMWLLYWHTQALDFVGVLAAAPGAFVVGGAPITLITLALFFGCTGKSAQIPLYTWLPDAMAGPTPVSALIHAATMVTAGVYLVTRTNLLFAMAPVAMAVVAGVGAVTALFAASIALKQWDIKKVLAYSTISQLGYMFLGVGTGAYAAGIFHLATQAFFKALLFLGAGSVIHAMRHAYHATRTHEDPQDMRNMGGLARHLPWTATTMWVGTLAIAGIPPFSGFFSKDEILGAAFARGGGQPLWYAYWAMGLAAGLLTAFYMARLMRYTFHGPQRTEEQALGHLHESPWVMVGPVVVLAALSFGGGVINVPELLGGGAALERWLEPIARGAVPLLPTLWVAPRTEWALLLLAVAVAGVGLAGAWRLLHPYALLPAHTAPTERGIASLLGRKYYVDELYDAVLVRPIRWLARVVLWKLVDERVVDGIGVNGIARLTRGLGWVGSKMQTGSVGVYVTLFVLGVILVLRAALR